ncbi:MAG: glycosyltransferase, partial [Methylomonas sp.]|nr:glycosyltransferase [Methylomonas sp.]
MVENVSAIVVNYNAGNYLRQCVDALLACPIVSEIVIVDNASVDGSLDAIEGLPRVEIVRNAKNLGFAAACNKGIERVGGADYILFLNPDCTFIIGTLKTLLDSMSDEQAIGMAGGLLVNPDGSEQAGGRRMMPTPWRSFVRAFGLHRFVNRWPRLFFDFYLHQQ